MNIALSFFTLMAAGFLILLYLRHPELRNFAFKLVFFLCSANFIYSIANIFTFFRLSRLDEDSYIFCLVQGFLINYSQLSILGWTTAIAYSMYKTVIQEDQNIENKETLFHFSSNIVPCILSL
jgi:hypothetical protein